MSSRHFMTVGCHHRPKFYQSPFRSKCVVTPKQIAYLGSQRGQCVGALGDHSTSWAETHSNKRRKRAMLQSKDVSNSRTLCGARKKRNLGTTWTYLEARLLTEKGATVWWPTQRSRKLWNLLTLRKRKNISIRYYRPQRGLWNRRKKQVKFVQSLIALAFRKANDPWTTLFSFLRVST